MFSISVSRVSLLIFLSAFLLALSMPMMAIADGGGGNNGGDKNRGGNKSGGSCFPAGTEISLPGGLTKNIEDIKVGEIVKSYDTKTGNFVDAKVLELESPIREGYYKLNEDLLRVTNEHPIYARKSDGTTGWSSIMPEATYADTELRPVIQLEVGDEVFIENNEWVKIKTIEYVPGNLQTFNLKTVDKYNTFFADGVLVHNKGGGGDKEKEDKAAKKAAKEKAEAKAKAERQAQAKAKAKAKAERQAQAKAKAAQKAAQKADGGGFFDDLVSGIRNIIDGIVGAVFGGGDKEKEDKAAKKAAKEIDLGAKSAQYEYKYGEIIAQTTINEEIFTTYACVNAYNNIVDSSGKSIERIPTPLGVCSSCAGDTTPAANLAPRPEVRIRSECTEQNCVKSNACNTTTGKKCVGGTGSYTCNARVVTPLPNNYLGSCESTATNSCRDTGTGIVQCGGCDAVAPGERTFSNPDRTWGEACNPVPANDCNSENPGTYTCGGTCSTTAPANPIGYGDTCQESNRCGSGNVGTQQCNGSCSESAPTCADASGDISSQPLLVLSGQSTQITWVVQFALDCSVTGTNGDNWSGENGNETTSTITEETTYTLYCVEGDFTDETTVQVAPTWQEF